MLIFYCTKKTVVNGKML